MPHHHPPPLDLENFLKTEGLRPDCLSSLVKEIAAESTKQHIYLVDGDNCFESLRDLSRLSSKLHVRPKGLHVIVFLSSHFWLSHTLSELFGGKDSQTEFPWVSLIRSHSDVRQAVDVRIALEIGRLHLTFPNASFFLVSSDAFVIEVRTWPINLH